MSSDKGGRARGVETAQPLLSEPQTPLCGPDYSILSLVPDHRHSPQTPPCTNYRMHDVLKSGLPDRSRNNRLIAERCRAVLRIKSAARARSSRSRAFSNSAMALAYSACCAYVQPKKLWACTNCAFVATVAWRRFPGQPGRCRGGDGCLDRLAVAGQEFVKQDAQ
jgi:hypothetical protein